MNGILTVKKACLNVRADDKVMYKGDCLPVFTSKVTGLKNGDDPVVCYSLNPSCTASPGVNAIIPLLKPFANAQNYTISYTNGKLYINPKGPGAKPLRPFIDCIEQVSSEKYIAHFYCINDNTTPVYLAAGADNKISSAGIFDKGRQPIIFAPRYYQV